MSAKSAGLIAIDSSAPATMSWKPASGSSPMVRPSVPRMNENSPICPSAAATVRATRVGIAERLDDAECRKRLDEDDQDQHRHDGERVREEHSRVEEHPDRHEEQHGEGVTQWKGVGGRLMTHVRLAHDETGQECAEREGHTEDRRRGVGDPERDRKDRQREQLP